MLEARALGEPRTIGRYRVLRTLDDTGRHAVMLVEAPNSRRRLAVRISREAGRSSEEIREAFRGEQEAARVLSDPRVVSGVELGEDPVYGPFLVSEMIEGLSLAECMRRGTLSFDQRLAVLVDVGRGLETAHAAGIVHAGLRPSRILVDREGRARLTGFLGPLEVPMIQVGAGWPYLAPERIAGAPSSESGDRYALAVIAFELLTGEVPREDGVLPEGLDPALANVFARALAREPQLRYPSLRAFLAEIIDAADLDYRGRAALVARLPRTHRAKPTPEEIFARQRRVVAVAAFGVVAALALRAGGDWLLDRTPGLAPLQAIEVSSVPHGATVLIDGVPVGSTPRRTFADADARRLRVEKEGYRPVDLILDGTESSFDVALQPTEMLRLARAQRRGAVQAAPPAGLRPEAEAPLEIVEQAGGLIPLLRSWFRD